MSMTFYRHDAGNGSSKHWWVTLAEDGSTIARTETYTASASADNAVSIVQAGNVTYSTFSATDGWRFRIKGLNGEIVFQSTRAYASETTAKAVTDRIRRDAPSARYLIAQAV